MNPIPMFNVADSFALNLAIHNQHRPVVVVVEENKTIAHDLVQALSADYTVHTFSAGDQALQALQHLTPQLIITDLTTRDAKGIPLCSQIKSDDVTSHLPVVILSDQTDVYSKIKGLSLGADDFLQYPFHALELRVRVQNLIQSRKLLQRKFSKNVMLRPSAVEAPSEDERFLKDVMTLVERNIENPHFNAATFAREMGMSKAQLYRRLVAVTGYSANDFMRRMRLQRAADLLEKHVGNVSEVAYRVGFTSLSYFARCFKDQHQHSPSEYARHASPTLKLRRALLASGT